MTEKPIPKGKELRKGYTTGSCAAAAAYAAATRLLSGKALDSVSLALPSGETVNIPVGKCEKTESGAFCAVRKDAGDDPDVTNGALICASVCVAPDGKITVDGGEGVGRVTKRGLDQPPGAAAINSTPRLMIKQSLERAISDAGAECGLSVIISVPEGKALAEKTFNPRLGIEGGISILGTTGIVEPMSEKALLDTIKISLNQKRAEGARYALIVPGNYGADFIREGMGLDPDARAVLVSNFIGDGLCCCRELGFSGVLLIGHIGKLVKLAGNMFNTHSKYGDCRMEIIIAHASALGLSKAAAREMLSCVTCDDALRVLDGEKMREKTLESIAARIEKEMAARCGEMASGAVLFSKEYGLLCETKGARALLDHIREE